MKNHVNIQCLWIYEASLKGWSGAAFCKFIHQTHPTNLMLLFIILLQCTKCVGFIVFCFRCVSRPSKRIFTTAWPKRSGHGSICTNRHFEEWSTRSFHFGILRTTLTLNLILILILPIMMVLSMFIMTQRMLLIRCHKGLKQWRTFCFYMYV